MDYQRQPRRARYSQAEEKPIAAVPSQGTYAGNSRRIRQPLGRTEELASRTGFTYGKESSVDFAGNAPDDWDGTLPSQVVLPKKRRKKQNTALWTLVSLVLMTALLSLSLFLLPQLTGISLTGLPSYAFANGTLLDRDAVSVSEEFDTFRKADVRYAGRIYPGVTIDGVYVGDMTPDEARNAVNAVAAQGGGDFSVTITVDRKSWVIDSTQVPMTRNIDAVIRQAYAIGRTNTRGGGVTPFEERMAAAEAVSKKPVSFTTVLTYDHSLIRALTDQIAAQYNVDPVNSQVESFNASSHAFTFTQDVSGRYLSADDLYAKVTRILESGNPFGTVKVTSQEVIAPVTRTELMNSFGRISSYTTTTTTNKNRNTNIELSAAAINGRVVQPGETFSFNNTTGERTASKGYKEAAAIARGQTKEEIGGGVCQTSSTLFNAVANANLEIIKRSPHAWPSSYIDKGLDATVNWPDVDFRWRNNTDYPIYIIAWYQSNGKNKAGKVTVELYGKTLGSGIEIHLESKVTRTIPKPEDVLMVNNPSLPAGTKKTTVQARKGYEVDTYQVWTRNGEEFQRNLLQVNGKDCHSTYKAYQETVEYN